MNTDADLSYRINDRDEFTWVGENWAGFALSNRAPELAPELVLGRPLWQFVTDWTTEHLYRQLLVVVRAGRPVSFPFRCDAPEERRFMEMSIRPEAGGGLLFETRALSLEARPAVALLERAGPRADGPLLRSCGWCKRVDVGGAWAEVEEAVRRLRLFEQEPPPVTHGMCEDCFMETSRKLAAWRTSR